MYVAALEGRMFSMSRYQRMLEILLRWSFHWSTISHGSEGKIGPQWAQTRCLVLVCKCQPSNFDVFSSVFDMTYILQMKSIAFRCCYYIVIYCPTIPFLNNIRISGLPMISPGYQWERIHSSLNPPVQAQVPGQGCGSIRRKSAPQSPPNRHKPPAFASCSRKSCRGVRWIFPPGG